MPQATIQENDGRCGTCGFCHRKAVVFCKIASKRRNYDFCMGTIIIVCGRSVHYKLKSKLSTFEMPFLILFEERCFKLNAETSGVLNIKQNTLQPLFIKGRLVSVLYTYFRICVTVSV
jgi:hypothetical protein